MRRTRGGEAFHSPQSEPATPTTALARGLEFWSCALPILPIISADGMARCFRKDWFIISATSMWPHALGRCQDRTSFVGVGRRSLGHFPLFFFLFCAARVCRFVTVWDGAAAPFPRTSMRIVVQGRLKLGSTHAATWYPSHESSPWDPTRQRLMRTPGAHSEHAPCKATLGTTGGGGDSKASCPRPQLCEAVHGCAVPTRDNGNHPFCISPWDGRY